MATRTDAAPQIAITMTHGPQPAIEQNLRQIFTAAVDAVPAPEPDLIAAQVNRSARREFSAALEAERGSWSRYRIAVRVQGMPVTIATVELTLPG